MSANRVPIHPDKPFFGFTQASVANSETAYVSGSIATVAQPTSQGGGIIQRLRVKAAGATTAGMIRFWIGFPSLPVWLLWREVPVTAISPDATTKSFEADVLTGLTDPLVLPYVPDVSGGMALGVSTENAETFNIIAEGGEY